MVGGEQDGLKGNVQERQDPRSVELRCRGKQHLSLPLGWVG